MNYKKNGVRVKSNLLTKRLIRRHWKTLQRERHRNEFTNSFFFFLIGQGLFREKGLSSTGLCIIKVTLESPGQAQIAPFTIFRFPCWSHHVRYPYDATTKKMISDWSLRESDSLLRDMSTDSYVLASNSRAPGRLAFSTSSGASNMRIKAICNYVIQRLLRLVHDFNILLWRTLPEDWWHI